jgi:hypothetical protein
LSGVSIDQDKADDLALTLSFEHSARGDIVGAVYALMHLSNPTKRARQIQDLLDRHAAALPAPPSSQSQTSPLWTALTASFHIPATWVYQSKALYARSCNESLAELHYLVLATDYAQAHACLLRRVAPRFVIDEDWEGLGDVLARFGEDSAQKVDAAVATSTEQDTSLEWKSGGGVYADFVELMVLIGPSPAGRRGSSGQDAIEKRKNKAALLERLQVALTELNARFNARTSGSSSDSRTLDLNKDREKLEERVALCEMGKAVARVIELEDDTGVADQVCTK